MITEESPRFLVNQSKKNPTDLRGRMELWKEFEETDENNGHHQNPFMSISAASNHKILGERNVSDSSTTQLETTPKEKLVINSQESHLLFSKIHSFSDSSPSAPYDPINNYTSPRPAFLRYNPDRRKEILLRMKDEDDSVDNSTEEDSLSASSSHKEIQENEEECSDVEGDEFEDQEAEEKRSWCSGKVLKLLLLFGVFFFSHYYLFSTSSSFSPVEENLSSDESLLYRHLLKTHMGLFNKCLDIREGMADLFSRGDSKMGHLGDSSMNDLLGSDETNEAFIVNELEESIEDLMYEDRSKNVEELVIEEERGEPMSCQEALDQEWNNQIKGSAKEEKLENGTIEIGEESVTEEREEIDEESVIEDEIEKIGEESVFEKEREEPVIFHESVEQERNIQSYGSAKEEILVSETAEREEPVIFSESVEHERNMRSYGNAKEEILVGETTEREEPVILHESVEHEMNIRSHGSAKEEILVSETTESLSDFEDSLIYKEVLAESNSALEFEGEYINVTSLTWKLVLEFASKKFPLLFLPLSLLTGVIMLSSVMFKYFAKSHKKSSRINAKDSNLNPLASSHSSEEHEEREESLVAPRFQSANEKRIYPSASVMEEMRIAGGRDSNVNNYHLPSSSSVSDEIKGFYATRPPTVELLGEFSFVEALAPKAASAQAMKSKRHDEPKSSILEEPRPSQFKRSSRLVKIKSPPSSNKVHPYLREESTPHENLVKKEVTPEKSEGKKKVTVTPLRRSNRLRSRVNSPTQ